MSTQSAEPSVRIHSGVADCGNFKSRRDTNCIELWYYCRGIDSQIVKRFNPDTNEEEEKLITGTGRVTFKIADAAAALEKSPITIKKYLRKGKELGFFRNVTRDGENITVYYSSLSKVALQHLEEDKQNLGAFAEIPLSDLKHLKYWAVQLTAQALQEASRFFAGRENPNKEIAQVEDLFDEASQFSRGATSVIHIGNRCMFVEPAFTMFGVSQKHIAEVTGRGIATIKRRLSNSYRSNSKRRVQVPQLVKRQLARHVVVDHSKLQDTSKPILRRDKRIRHDRLIVLCKNFPELHEFKNTFVCKGKVFECGTNIYAREFQISSGKAVKYRFRRLANAVKSLDEQQSQQPIKRSGWGKGKISIKVDQHEKAA